MKTTADSINSAFSDVLTAPGRSLDIAESDDVYGWLVGNWDLTVCHYFDLDVESQPVKGRVHAGWVLEGRAIQDVWHYPLDKQSTGLGSMITYGTTFRVWDAAIKAWRISWIIPVRNHREEQIGRRVDEDIIQINNSWIGFAGMQITPANLLKLNGFGFSSSGTAPIGDDIYVDDVYFGPETLY